MITLAILIPFSGRYVPPEFALGLTMLQYPSNTTHSLLSTKGMIRDQARNTLVKEAISYGAKYVVFLDDDTVPPPDALKKLFMALETADDDVIACGGIYTTKSEPAEPLIFKERDGGPFWKWRVGEVFPVEQIATGCLMIRTSAFAKIPEPWFRDITCIDDIGDDPSITLPPDCGAFHITDDIYYANKCKAAGFRMLAHGGVLCVHWDQQGKPYVLSKDSYPMQGAPEQMWYHSLGVPQ